MKNILIRIFSGVLALVCLVCLVIGAVNIKDILDCKDVWEKIRKDALESFEMLEDGIAQLKENEQAYAEGVSAYEEGLESYEAGQNKLAAGGAALSTGQAAYDANAEKLAEAHRQYEEGQRALEQGKAELAQGKAELEQGKAEVEAGKAQLEANRAAYEEGKAQLERVAPIYYAAKPYYDACMALKAEYDQAVADGDMVKAAILQEKVTEQQILLNASLGGYSINTIITEYEAGQAKIAEYEAGQAKVAAGEKAIAEGEKKIAEAEQTIAAGEAKLAASKAVLDENDRKLAEAKSELDKGYANYASGKAQLENGAADLAEGLKQLNVYEGGQQQVAEGLDLVIATDTYYNKKGDALVESIADRLGADFSYWKTDADGYPLVLNDTLALDLDKALRVCKTGRDFVDDTTEAVTKELTSRIIHTAALLLASLVGLAAGIVGVFALALGSAITSSVCAFLAIVGITAGFILGGFQCPLSRIAGSSVPGIICGMLIALACAAIAHTVIGYICAAKKTAAVTAAAN